MLENGRNMQNLGGRKKRTHMRRLFRGSIRRIIIRFWDFFECNLQKFIFNFPIIFNFNMYFIHRLEKFIQQLHTHLIAKHMQQIV